MSLKNYGKLYGFIELIKDTHHDEVFIQKTDTVVIRNNKWLYSNKELREIAYELGLRPGRCKVNYKFTVVKEELYGI